jgi:homoserine/homoserine lactone efflux protein
MELKVWIMFLLTEFLLSITPGPAVLLVSSQGLRYGGKSSYYGALGISSGNVVYFIMSALGIGALILATGNLFEYIKIGGAVYLMGRGIRMIFKSVKYKRDLNPKIELYQNRLKSFSHGFITQVANPKAVLFFIALLPQFIDREKNITTQFMILGSTTIILETIILIFYGWLASKGKKIIRNRDTSGKWKDRFAGIVLLGLGVNLLFSKLNLK